MKTIPYIFLLIIIITVAVFTKFSTYNFESKEPLYKSNKSEDSAFKKNILINEFIGIGFDFRLMNHDCFIPFTPTTAISNYTNEGFCIGRDVEILQQQESLPILFNPDSHSKNAKENLAGLFPSNICDGIYKPWIESYDLNNSSPIRWLDTTFPLPLLMPDNFSNAFENLFELNLHGACDDILEKRNNDTSIYITRIFCIHEIIDTEQSNHHPFQLIALKTPFKLICKTHALPGCQVSCLGNNYHPFQFISLKTPFKFICKSPVLPGCQDSCLGNV